MTESSFNPNDVGKPNGNYFALPYSLSEAEIALISVPWDVTTSYNAGTSKGPDAIIDASVQVDLFDFDVKNAWDIKIGTTNIPLLDDNTTYRKLAERVIEHLEDGGATSDDAVVGLLNQINQACTLMNQRVYDTAKSILKNKQIAAVVGGDHSVPLGLIKAVAEQHGEIGVLHIDAHADLRNAYEGFTYSHASIMYNVLNECKGVKKLVQVGVRDLGSDENNLAQTDERITMFNDYRLKENEFNGITWSQQCAEIIGHLPQQVHISFDIDGLTPDYCPHTGTPVPGGLSFQQAVFLIKSIVQSGRKIVGFDLCEVAPGDHSEWDANVGARILYKLCCYTHAANQS